MLYYLSFGIVLGVTAGFSPGPLLALVVSETLAHGLSAGIRVALAPLLTDAPIVLLTLLVFTQLSGIDHILGAISLAGGCYVLYMAWESARGSTARAVEPDQSPRSLTKGVLTNALSPHPYLFWLSVGAPTVAKSVTVNVIAPAVFIGGFYLCLVGSKVLLAVLVGKSRVFLAGRVYVYTMRGLAGALGVFAVVLFADGLRLLGLS